MKQSYRTILDHFESQLAEAVDVAERNALLLRAYQDLAPGRRCLVFCVNVAHAKEVASLFQKAGLRAAAVWGAMARTARRETLARFSSGEVEVVTNCAVLTEGFDEPRIDCIIMARPTQSRLLYAQMVGRGTRLHPEKSDLLVIDVADNTRKHTLVGLHALFDLHQGLEVGHRRPPLRSVIATARAAHLGEREKDLGLRGDPTGGRGLAQVADHRAPDPRPRLRARRSRCASDRLHRADDAVPGDEQVPGCWTVDAATVGLHAPGESLGEAGPASSAGPRCCSCAWRRAGRA